MTQTIVFIHGAWVTPHCWEPFRGYFTARGYQCIAPAWPGKDRAVEAIRADPSPLLGLGIGEITNHYEQIVRALPEPPILIGHSFGGLIVQVLLDRGLGACGVAIDPAPPRGVFAFEPSAFRSLRSVLLTWRGWRKIVRWSYANFRYAFVHSLPEDEARAAYETHVTPETGRIFFQGAFAAFARHSPTMVNFGNATRPPLLILAGADDHIVPASVVRRTYRKYGASTAVTDFREFPGRTHWIIAQHGWEEVAGATHDWIAARGAAPVARDPGARPGTMT
jgi:pimeloyl-ACP methyl ester carboxylesterase